MENWLTVGALEEIPRQGARVMETAEGKVAIFRCRNDKVFALLDECPHKGGPLSQGIVHGEQVTCPMHNWVIKMTDGQAVAPDEGCVPRFPVKVEDGIVYLSMSVAN